MMEYERRGDDQIRAAFALGGEAEYYQPKDPGPECLWCDGTGVEPRPEREER